MEKEKQIKIEENMNDVIKTSQEMRNYLLNEEIPLSEKQNKLKVLRTALDANRNIVSASVVQIHIEEFR